MRLPTQSAILSVNVDLDGKGIGEKELAVRLIATTTGEQAMEVLRNNRQVKMVITQWHLPDLEKPGDLVGWIKKYRSRLPVLVLIDGMDEESEIKARKSGAAAVFSGNVAGAILLSAMKSMSLAWALDQISQPGCQTELD